MFTNITICTSISIVVAFLGILLDLIVTSVLVIVLIVEQTWNALQKPGCQTYIGWCSYKQDHTIRC